MKNFNYSFKLIAFSAILFCSSGFVFGQVEINTVEGLKAIQNDLAGSYKLTADITLTEDWTPISDFTGIFDGNGHIIFGLKVNNTATNSLALFGQTHNATISKLGIEKANLVGNVDVAGIIGKMYGGSLSQCYVSNSYFEGSDHVAGLVGRLSNLTDVADDINIGVVSDCYSSANLYSRNSQAGGLVGVIYFSKISKCYFSGLVQSVNNRPGGITALISNGSTTTPAIIEYCAELAPYVLGPGNYRIGNPNGKTCTFTENYGLGKNLQGSKLITMKFVPTLDVNSGATKGHGAEMPSDEAAKDPEFYALQMQWDFVSTWKIIGDGYPTLAWQTGPVNASLIKPADLNLTSMTPFDLNKLYTTCDTKLKYASSSPNVTFSDQNIMSIAPDAVYADGDVITITVLGNANYASTGQTFNVKLYHAPVMISTPADFTLLSQMPFQYFKLANDIDMKDVVFTGLCTEDAPFKGVLDGAGHCIKNLTISSSSSNLGFINTSYRATVKNLGFDNVSITNTSTSTDAACGTGCIIGNMWISTIENCWVKSNCYIEGNVNVGAIAGAVRTNSFIKNSYGECSVKSRSVQVGGLAGLLSFGHVENCYFSGTVQNLLGRACGLVSYTNIATSKQTDNTIKNSVCLAPTIYSGNNVATQIFRIYDNAGSAATLTNNYALTSTKIGKDETTNSLVNEITTFYGAENLHGANIPNDTDAKTSAFYTTTMGWDVTNVWKIAEALSYPTLKVFDNLETAASSMKENPKCILVANGNAIQISNLKPSSIVTIYSTMGNIVSKAAVTSSTYSKTLPTQGFYVVEIKNEGQRSIFKVISK